MGTSAFSEKILKAFIENKYNIVAVFTQPDKKANREKEVHPHTLTDVAVPASHFANSSGTLYPQDYACSIKGVGVKMNPVKKLSLANKLSLFQPEKFNDAIVNEIKNLKPDIIILAAYGRILPEKIFQIPGFGGINVHASLLPELRGPSPIQNALINGQKETGVTIIQMDAGVDTGDILAQKKVAIESDDNLETLSEKISETGVKLLLNTIPGLIKGEITPKKQDDEKATLSQLIERDDGRIFWDEQATKINNKFRAFYPWPGIFCFWKRKNQLVRIKFHKIRPYFKKTENKSKLGEVFTINDHIAVQASKGVIILEQIQIEGKKAVSANEFINGYPDFIGSILL